MSVTGRNVTRLLGGAVLGAALLSGCGTGEPGAGPGGSAQPDAQTATVQVVAVGGAEEYSVAVALEQYLEWDGTDADVLDATGDPAEGSVWEEESWPENTVVVTHSLRVPGQLETENPSPDWIGVEAEASVEAAQQYLHEQFGTDVQVLGSSDVAPQLAAVAPRAVAAERGWTSLDHVGLGVAQPAEPEDEGVHVDLGSTPEAFRAPILQDLREKASDQAPVAEVDAELADLGFVFRQNPVITDRGLRVLEDENHVLPAGRILVIGDPESIEADIAGPTGRVLETVGEESLVELIRMVSQAETIPAAGLELDAPSAARWWLEHQVQLISTDQG